MTVQTTRRRRAGIALAAGLTAALTLTACATGQDAQTASEVSVVDGGSGDVGSMSVRNAGVAPPASVSGYASGSSAQLVAVLVNNSGTNDVLTSVSSAAATSVVISPAYVATTDASASPAADGAPAATNTAISMPANNLVRVGTDGGAGIELIGLKSTLISGQSIAVTFTFQAAGSVTVHLPVKLMSGGTGGATVDVEPSTEG